MTNRTPANQRASAANKTYLQMDRRARGPGQPLKHRQPTTANHREHT